MNRIESTRKRLSKRLSKRLRCRKRNNEEQECSLQNLLLFRFYFCFCHSIVAPFTLHPSSSTLHPPPFILHLDDRSQGQSTPTLLSPSSPSPGSSYGSQSPAPEAPELLSKNSALLVPSTTPRETKRSPGGKLLRLRKLLTTSERCSGNLVMVVSLSNRR